MKIGILGTGMVGSTIGKKLINLGYEVMIGSRVLNNDRALLWTKANGPRASHGTFADTVSFGEVLFNCTLVVGSINVLESAAETDLSGVDAGE